MKDGMVVLDISARIVDVNLAAQNILQIPGDQALIGQQLTEVLTRWPELANQFKDGIHSIDEIPLEVGGEKRWYELDLSPLRDNQGKLIDQLIIVGDITEHKIADTRLQQSEARFRQIVENASDFIYRTNAEGFFTYANPAALNIVGVY